jgi:AcrR family transcriptional regulator
VTVRKAAAPRKKPTAKRRTQAERSALSDRRIVAAAVRLLVDQGVEGTTVQAIAARAGYNHSLLVHRYGGKAGLLMRVMDKVTADWQALVASHVGEHRGIDALRAFLDAHIAFIETEPDEIMAMYRLWFHVSAPGDEYRNRLAQAHRAQRQTVAGWLRHALDRRELQLPSPPEIFAERFCAMVAGFMYQWLTDTELPIVTIYRGLQQDLAALRAIDFGSPAAAAQPDTRRRSARSVRAANR